MILVLIRSVRLSFLAVTIDTIDLVAAKTVGDAERKGMGMDVVAGIDAIVVVESGGFSDVPTEGVAD